jgi:probable HAF family extracellular repeat protein
LGTLQDYSLESRASDINDLGQVTGTSAANDGTHHAFLYSNGSMRDPGIIPGTPDNSFSNAINNKADVVGSSGYGFLGDQRAFLYSAGVMRQIGPSPLPANVCSVATDINDRSQIVGFTFATCTYGPCIYNNTRCFYTKRPRQGNWVLCAEPTAPHTEST